MLDIPTICMIPMVQSVDGVSVQAVQAARGGLHEVRGEIAYAAHLNHLIYTIKDDEMWLEIGVNFRYRVDF